MRFLFQRIKPASGLSHFFHGVLLVVLPIVVFVLVRLDFVQLALSVVVLSKWRMLAVRPRFWAANVRANAVDLMVGLSVVSFMAHASDNLVFQLMWVVLYAIWLMVIKPASSRVMVSLQAAIGQLAALMALFVAWTDGPLFGLTLAGGVICFMAARHFLDVFEEPYAKLLAYTWGYFGAALTWTLGHWLIFYGAIAQPTLLLSIIGYGLAGMYYLDHEGRLGNGVRRQIVFIMIAIVVVVLAFSDWGDKVV